MLPPVWHWSFDPVLVSLGPVSVRWYGLLFVGAFLVGQRMLVRLLGPNGIAESSVDRWMVYALLGTVLGARLVHCLVYDPGYYLSNPLAILRIWEGGLASHGGVVGMLIGLWVGVRRSPFPQSFVWLLDRVSIPAALGGAMVRTANFLNSEIVGRPTGSSWGVVFDTVDAMPRHPVQLYEALAYFATFLFLSWRHRVARENPPTGLLLGWFLVLVFAARIAAEHVKVPQAAYEAAQLFTVGQWLSVPFVLVGAALLWRSWRKGVSDSKPTISPC